MIFFDLKYQLLIYRYRKWRKLGMDLAHKVLKEIPTDIMSEAARDMHMMSKDGIMIFDSEDGTCYLMDRAVFDIERNRKRSVESYFEKNKDIVSLREKRLLEAMKDSVYSMFIVEKIKRGFGMHITDTFSGEKLFLCDINLSQTIQERCLLSCRIISIDNIHFTSGCACFFDEKMLEPLKLNFLRLFETKKGVFTWQQMMRKYNPHFLKIMKQTNKRLIFCNG